MSAHLKVEAQLPVIQAFRAGRSSGQLDDAVIVRNVFVAETRREALRIAAPHLGDSYSSFKDWGLFEELVQDPAAAAGRVRDAAMARSVVGDPDDIAAALQSIASTVGARRFIVRTQWQGMSTEMAERSITLLGHSVLPKLEHATSAWQ
jgi:alkanesulfonate monooxygenase SsuD/methylene tetrahydromethanopterin reductase-like flavin-dependent oxidoreductase (luciferase family)